MDFKSHSFIFLVSLYQSTLSLVSDYKYWSPDNIKDLWCPKNCSLEMQPTPIKVEEDYCCSCYAVPQWELLPFFPNISYSLLQIETIDVSRRKSRFVTQRISNKSNITSFFGVVHISGRLKQIPDKMCDFRIVHINFWLNLLTEIGDLSCSAELDTLILKDNRIQFVSNTSFTGLFKLRFVDLSGNQIKKLDNNIIGNIHVLSMHLEYNLLETLDVSNIFIPNKTMCWNSFANNKRAVQVTNQNNYQLGSDTDIVCGSIDYANVTMSVNPLSLISKNIKPEEIVKYMQCGFYKFDGSAFNCDCSVGEFLKVSLDTFKRFWKKDESQNYCNAPVSLANISISEVWNDPILADKMICDIVDNCTKTVNCHCQCTSQPSRQTLIVDCSNQKCKQFPDVVPNVRYGFSIVLNMSNNSIEDLVIKNYFRNVKTIDLSKNPVSKISQNISTLFGLSDLIMSDHNLKYLPKEIQQLDPNVFQFGQRGIPCTCENRWIGRWRRLKKASANHTLYCSNYNKTFEEKLDEFLGCDTLSDPGYIYSSYLLLVIVVFIILPSSLYVFRYELIILKRKYSRAVHNIWKYDLYISFDDQDAEVRGFVIHMLIPFLETQSFSTFSQCRDSLFGSSIEESVTDNIHDSKTVLIVYSRAMFTRMDNSCKTRRLEYYLAWNYYTKGLIDGLQILHFDNSTFQPFQCGQTKALFNCGMGICVSDRTRDIYQSILKFLGKPLKLNKKQFNTHCNAANNETANF